jgi:hypothetical protein
MRRNSTPRTTLKIAVLALMLSDSVTAAVKAGFLIALNGVS